jgi:hypothetical protein
MKKTGDSSLAKAAYVVAYKPIVIGTQMMTPIHQSFFDSYLILQPAFIIELNILYATVK